MTTKASSSSKNETFSKTLEELKNEGIFKQTMPAVALKIAVKSLGGIMKNARKVLMHNKRTRNVIDTEDSQTKILLLDPKYKNTDLSDLPEVERELLSPYASTAHTYNLTLDYDALSAEEALRKVIPSNVVIPTAFEQVGHIAHLNLRDDQLPFRYIIGQTIIDKNPSIQTVVNKVGSIDTKFREFKMELLCGKQDMNVELKEHGVRFRFNFGEVYWNSRLSTEHQRLTEFFKKNDIVCDMFAGVGPFALPAAKDVGCTVYANDLNPKSYAYMQDNVKLNKVTNLVKCYNMDAREFARKMVSDGIQFTHAIMNLPASAVEFLDVFVGLYNKNNFIASPIIHCYTFVKGEKSASNSTKAKQAVEQEIIKTLEERFGKTVKSVDLEYVSVFNVRDVAPKKEMFCVSFRLPRSIAVLEEVQEKVGVKRKESATTTFVSEDESSPEKKQKV